VMKVLTVYKWFDLG